MKTVKGRIPLAGIYNFNVSVPDDWTNKEVFAKLEKDFNESASNTKLYSVMQTGAGINYPLNFAVVDEVVK